MNTPQSDSELIASAAVPVAEVLYLGLGGCVVALHRRDGRELWRRPLRSGFVGLAWDANQLYALVEGHCYCLDPHSGAIRWHNALRRLGHGLGSFAGPGIQSGGGISAAAQAQASSNDNVATTVVVTSAVT